MEDKEIERSAYLGTPSDQVVVHHASDELSINYNFDDMPIECLRPKMKYGLLKPVLAVDI